MSFQFSIVIICKDEAGHIGQTLRSIHSLSDDIIAYDTGSTDGTIEVLEKFPVRFHHGPWEGFGKARQKAVQFSRYDWVFIIDADEIVTNALAEELKQLKLEDEKIVFRILLQNHLGSRHIKWGIWGNDFRIRLYNKKIVGWNELIVHEELIIPGHITVKKLNNPILHFTAEDISELTFKMHHYALLTAEQYYLNGKRARWIKRIFGPLFAFIKSYFLKYGFLDGKSGFDIARIIAGYTFLKYKRLHELWRNK